MVEITVEQIKQFREATGLGLLEARNALRAAEGNAALAIEYIRKRTGQIVESRKARSTTAGIVESYIHQGNCVGVLIEVNCETDFVARNDTFRALVKNIAMQVAAAAPSYVSRRDIPREVIDKEVEIARQSAPSTCDELGKKKYVEGKLSRFYQTYVLLDQPYIKNSELTVAQLIDQSIVVLKENITVARFVRMQIGGTP